MIYSVKGKLIVTELNMAVIECGGVGYAVKTSLNSISHLPQIGEEVMMYTYLSIREDAADLYGFYEINELNTFKMLISVTGVGPKAAISILSSIASEKLAFYIASGDAKSITAAPGVGLKTAQRIVLDLKDKISKEQLTKNFSGVDIPDMQGKTGNSSEAITALEVLGYSRSEATSVITKLSPDMPVEEMIKQGLKDLAGKV